MLNLSKKSVTKHHRFNYHPRNFNERKETFEKKKKSALNKAEDPDFDVIKHYALKKKRKAVRYDLIFISIIFLFTILYFDKVRSYFDLILFNKFGKLTLGGMPLDSSSIATYLSLILEGMIFIKRSKR